MDSNSSGSRWYHNVWFVLLMLFFVLGPFGLPLLYKSPKFNTAWKIILTVVMIFVTWYLIVGTWKAVQGILNLAKMIP